jgi:hypothetical protein
MKGTASGVGSIDIGKSAGLDSHKELQYIPVVRLDAAGANAPGYANTKVDALLAGQISICDFTERDYIDLALAALDQAGASISLQRRVNELVEDELGMDQGGEAEQTPLAIEPAVEGVSTAGPDNAGGCP